MTDGLLPWPFPASLTSREEAALGCGLIKVWRRRKQGRVGLKVKEKERTNNHATPVLSRSLRPAPEPPRGAVCGGGSHLFL